MLTGRRVLDADDLSLSQRLIYLSSVYLRWLFKLPFLSISVALAVVSIYEHCASKGLASRSSSRLTGH